MGEIAFIALFCSTMVIAPIAWLRTFKAKTQREYMTYVALFVVPILMVLLLGHLLGIVEPRAAAVVPPAVSMSTPELSWAQLALLAVAGVIWLVGGNVLMYRHAKRVGRSFWSMLNPFRPQFRDFTVREWFILASLAVSALALSAVAFNLGAR